MLDILGRLVYCHVNDRDAVHTIYIVLVELVWSCRPDRVAVAMRTNRRRVPILDGPSVPALFSLLAFLAFARRLASPPGTYPP